MRTIYRTKAGNNFNYHGRKYTVDKVYEFMVRAFYCDENGTIRYRNFSIGDLVTVGMEPIFNVK